MEKVGLLMNKILFNFLAEIGLITIR